MKHTIIAVVVTICLLGTATSARADVLHIGHAFKKVGHGIVKGLEFAAAGVGALVFCASGGCR